MIRKKTKSGQTMVEYLIIMVVLAIGLIAAVYTFRDALKGLVRKAAQSQTQRGQQQTAQRLPSNGSHSSKKQQAKLPKWDNKYVPKDTLWKHEHDPEKKGLDDRYKPAKSQE